MTLPLVGTVTVREPVTAPKSPDWATVTLTDNGCGGAGLAVTVNEASPPSVIPLPAVTLISGVTGGGVPSRHSSAARYGVQRESPVSSTRASAAVSGVLYVPVVPDSAIHARHQSLRCFLLLAVFGSAS